MYVPRALISLLVLIPYFVHDSRLPSSVLPRYDISIILVIRTPYSVLSQE